MNIVIRLVQILKPSELDILFKCAMTARGRDGNGCGGTGDERQGRIQRHTSNGLYTIRPIVKLYPLEVLGDENRDYETYILSNSEFI